MSKAHRLFGCAGVVSVVLYVAFAHEGKLQWLTYDAIGMVSVAAILLGVAKHRPRRSLPWIVMALGVALFSAGDFVWGYCANVLHRDAPVLSAADVLYCPPACCWRRAACCSLGSAASAMSTPGRTAGSQHWAERSSYGCW